MLPVGIEIGMPKEDFVEKYSEVVYSAIKAACQEVQSNGKKKAKALWDVKETLPTLGGLKALLEKSPDDMSEEDKKTLIWYYDAWLVAVVGNVYWGEKYHHYNLETDKVKMCHDQKKRTFCSTASVAFDLLTYGNCHDKWLVTFELKKKFSSATIPRNDEKFQAKYTLTTDGQKKYGGWKEEAYEEYNKLVDWVTNWRKDEAENGKVLQEYALKITQEAFNITDLAYKKDRCDKKRKANAEPEEVPKARAKAADDNDDFLSSDSDTDDGTDGSEKTAVLEDINR